MKKIYSILLVAAAAMAVLSCQKQETIAPEAFEEFVLTFTSEKPAFDDQTKTEWTGETIQWSVGDKIAVAYTVADKWQNASGDASNDAKLYKSEALKEAEASGVAQFNVSTSFKGTTEGTHVFYGVYPAPTETGFSKAPIASLTVPSTQTPKSDSFDPAADLMVGVSGEYDARPASSEKISLLWDRLVAHAVITLKNINGFTEGEKISSITLTAQEGANLVGKQNVNLITKDVVKNNNASNVVEIAGGNLSVENGTVSFWACMLPETITSLTVEVETDKAVYTREITGIEKVFKQNARNTLGVNMAAAGRVAKEGKTVIYTVESTSKVNTTGEAPANSTVTYSSTYSTKCQLTKDNSMTFTVNGFDGYKVNKVSLSMKSNSSGGAGTLSVKVGENEISSISDSKFNSNSWHGSWSTEYVDINPIVIPTLVGTGESITITITATANSLYCQRVEVAYTDAN